VTSDLELLNLDLDALGASQFQRQTMQSDATRARAALAEAAKRGAGQPLSYAMSLFNSPNFSPSKPKLSLVSNASVLGDPKISDDGERIWHAEEVDDQWRHGYLDQCIKAYLGDWDLERPGDLPRYAPSQEEWTGWMTLMKERAGVLKLDPSHIRWNAAYSLAAWAELWKFEDLLADICPEAPVEQDPFAGEIPF